VNIHETNEHSLTVVLPDEEPSYVYMFYSDGKVKIGTSRDPVARLDKLQNSSAAGIQVVWIAFGGRRREGELHQRFKADRLYGEWFHLSDDIRAFIEAASTVNAPFSKMLAGVEHPGSRNVPGPQV
jgi:hypothetical protein